MTMALSREEKKKEVNDLILTLSHDYTQIIPREVIAEHNSINWGNNGIGSRWVGGRFNYSIVYGNKHVKTYSESLDDKVPDEVLAAFQTTIRGNSAAGIFVHSVRENIITRPINKKIDAEIKKSSCVVCGTRSDIITDHKNDMYNDTDVLDTKTQEMDDFQPLCNHCNLQKRQIFRDETTNGRIYSAKNMQQYKMYPFEFPWEKKAFDLNDITCKKDTYWYDPVEFNQKISDYMPYKLLVVDEIKRQVRAKTIKEY